MYPNGCRKQVSTKMRNYGRNVTEEKPPRHQDHYPKEKDYKVEISCLSRNISNEN
jgi:hypothetical protein